MRIPVTKLKALREQQWMTQDDLARLSGVSRQTIARLERGDASAYPTTLCKLAAALGVDRDMLVKRHA